MTRTGARSASQAPTVVPRLVISEALALALVYLWLRDGNLNLSRAFDRSHAEDEIALVFARAESLTYSSSARLEDARALLRLAPPGVILPSPANEEGGAT